MPKEKFEKFMEGIENALQDYKKVKTSSELPTREELTKYLQNLVYDVGTFTAICYCKAREKPGGVVGFVDESAGKLQSLFKAKKFDVNVNGEEVSGIPTDKPAVWMGLSMGFNIPYGVTHDDGKLTDTYDISKGVDNFLSNRNSFEKLFNKLLIAIREVRHLLKRQMSGKKAHSSEKTLPTDSTILAYLERISKLAKTDGYRKIFACAEEIREKLEAEDKYNKTNKESVWNSFVELINRFHRTFKKIGETLGYKKKSEKVSPLITTHNDIKEILKDSGKILELFDSETERGICRSILDTLYANIKIMWNRICDAIYIFQQDNPNVINMPKFRKFFIGSGAEGKVWFEEYQKWHDDKTAEAYTERENRLDKKNELAEAKEVQSKAADKATKYAAAAAKSAAAAEESAAATVEASSQVKIFAKNVAEAQNNEAEIAKTMKSLEKNYNNTKTSFDKTVSNRDRVYKQVERVAEYRGGDLENSTAIGTIDQAKEKALAAVSRATTDLKNAEQHRASAQRILENIEQKKEKRLQQREEGTDNGNNGAIVRDDYYFESH